MSTRNAMDTGADGKTPAAPPPSPFSFFLSQQGESDSVVVPFNEMLIGNNTNRSRNNMYSSYRNNTTTRPSLGKAYLSTYCCCSPKTSSTATAAATASAAPSSSSSSARTGINNRGASSSVTCVTCHRPFFATKTTSSTVYPSPELSDLGDDDIAALEGIVLDVDNSYTSHKLRRRPSLDFNQNRVKRFRPSPPSPRLSQTTLNNCDEDDLTVVSDTVTDDTASSSPAPSNSTFASSTSDLINPIVVESPPYHPADVFPDSNSGWHEQIIEYDWASSTDEDERRTAFSDSYWSGIDCRDETFSELETRFGLDGMDSPPYQPQDYNEMNPTMDPQETRWFEQQLTTLSSGSRRRREDSPPYVPFDYNTLNSEMDPNEDRFFEQSHTKYVSTTADEDCSDSASCDGDVSSNDMSLSDDDMCPSDDDF